MLSLPAPGELEGMIKQLDDIEMEVNKMKVPLAFADQFYALRDHIGFVRGRYSTGGGPGYGPIAERETNP